MLENCVYYGICNSSKCRHGCAERNAGHLEEKTATLQRELDSQQYTISSLQNKRVEGESSLDALNRDTAELESINHRLSMDNSALEGRVKKVR